MNIVCVSGHLGRDIEIRVDESQRVEGEFSVAINDYINKDENGQAKYWTTWATVVVRGKLALSLQDQLYKGRFVTVEGALRSRNYRVSDDKTVTVHYVLASRIEFDPRAVPPAHNEATPGNR